MPVQPGQRSQRTLGPMLGPEALRGGSVGLPEPPAQRLRTEAVPFRPGLEGHLGLARQRMGEGVRPVVEVHLGRSNLLEEQRGRGLEVPPGEAHDGIERVDLAGGELRTANERKVQDHGASGPELVPVRLERTMEDDLSRFETVATPVPGLHEVAGEHHRGVRAQVSMARQAGPAGVVVQDGHLAVSTSDRPIISARFHRSGAHRPVRSAEPRARCPATGSGGRGASAVLG